MKNVKLISLLAFVLLMVTGCGTTNLVCEMKDEDFGMDLVYDMEFNGDDELETVKMIMVSDMGDLIPEDELDTFCEDYKDLDGVECSAAAEGEELTITVDIDLAKVEDELLQELDFEETTLDKIKTQYEDDGYTCE